jgi:hypothetical protein
MTEFEIYSKVVTVGGKELRLRPLTGRFIGRLFKAINSVGDIEEAINSAGDLEEVDKTKPKMSDMKEFLNEETMAAIHEVCLETMKRSYPDASKEGLEDFVTVNMFSLFEKVCEINLPSKE